MDNVETHMSNMFQVGGGGGGAALYPSHPHLYLLPPPTRQAHSLLLAGHAVLHTPQRRIVTHRSTLSHTLQGTLTHMAPEIMLEGKISKAADVRGGGRGAEGREEREGGRKER